MSVIDLTSGPRFETLTVEEHDRLRVILRGELDLASVTEAQQEIRSALTASEQVAVDLSDLSLIDSTGVRLLIETERDARARSRVLAIRRGCDEVQRVLELTGAAERLPFEAES